MGATGHGTHALPAQASPHTPAVATDVACSWQGRCFSSSLDSGAAVTVAAMVRGLPAAQHEGHEGSGCARSKIE